MAARPLLQRLRDLHRRRIAMRHAGRIDSGYAAWIDAHDRLTVPVREALLQALKALPSLPEIGVLLDLGDAPQAAAAACVASLHGQLYPHWQLTVLPAGKPVTAAWWRTVQAVGAPWLLPLSAHDRLAPHALLLLVQAALRFKHARVVYADHDELDAHGRRTRPWFKSDWNPALLLSCNYLLPLAMFDTKRLQSACGVVPDGDLATLQHAAALWATEGADEQAVVHVPHVLAHTTRPPQASAEAERWFVARRKARAPPDAQPPLVSVIVPTRDGLLLLRRCVQGVLAQTAWPRIELIVVDNGSVEPATLDYLQALQAQDPRVRVLRDARPFNFSALNNLAAGQARGELLLLLNNDIEFIEPNWLSEMVALAVLPGTGAVGARLWYPDGSLQHAGLFTGLNGVVGDAHRRLPHDMPGHQSRALLVQEFSAVTAACLLVKKAVFDEVGGFDEEHFAVAYNDVDFCLRVQRAGYRNLWTPHAQLVHHESVTRGSDADPAHAARFERECAAMQTRWGPRLARDPFYNPNLSLTAGAFQLAWPPRVSLLRPWFAASVDPAFQAAEPPA